MANKSANELPCPPPTTASVFCLVAPEQIHYLCCLLEAYEGLAISTTLDPGLGLLRLAVARGCEDDLLRVLESEREALKLRAVNPIEIDGDPTESCRASAAGAEADGLPVPAAAVASPWPGERALGRR